MYLAKIIILLLKILQLYINALILLCHTARSDYTAIINRTITLGSGARSQVVPVPIINDTIFENLENFLAQLVLVPDPLVLRGPVIVSPDHATVTIRDDDSKCFN